MDAQTGLRIGYIGTYHPQNGGAAISCTQLFRGLADAGHTLIGGETPDPERLYEAVMEEVKRARLSGIDAEDFERQRRAAMGSFFRSFNSLEFIANNYCAYRFSDTDLFEIIEILHSIELEELEQRLRTHLVEDGAAFSIVNPKAAERV